MNEHKSKASYQTFRGFTVLSTKAKLKNRGFSGFK